MKPAHNEYLFIEAIRDGYFQIDKNGKIWRTATRNGKNKFAKVSRREMKCKSYSGYIQIGIYKNRKQYYCYAHRLIWIYFNGEIPDELEVNHKNGIKINNCLENLELVTRSGNNKHAFETGLINVQGESNSHAKLTNSDIRLIRSRYENSETQTEIAKDFNIKQQQISRIVNRKHWSHIL